MHEMALMEQVVDIVLEEAQRQGAARVVAVHLTFGELADVIVDMVPGLFEFLARGTAAEGAQVAIERTPAYVQCRKCNEAWRIDVRDEATWTCPPLRGLQEVPPDQRARVPHRQHRGGGRL